MPVLSPQITLLRKLYRYTTMGMVSKLLQGWKELYPFYKVAYTLLNVEQEVMNILQENGWLIPAKGPSIDNYPLYMYNTMDVDAFTASLVSRSVKGPRLAGESLSLRALSRSSIVAISKILSAIFQGQLIPSDTGTMQPLFQRLVLSHTDIRGWQTMQKPKNGERVLLTREEVAEILAIRKHVITHLLQHGLLVEEYNLYASVPVFQSEMVEAFRQTYVFLREVAVLLDETPAMVYRYVKDGRLRPILGDNATAHKTNLLFRREEIRSFLLDYPSIYQKWS